MNDEAVKEHLHDELRWARQQIVEQLDSLDDYDIRRPLTRTGTNLLGLIKHLAMSETVYLGEVFGRAATYSHAVFDDPSYRNRDSMWVTAQESRVSILTEYQRACDYADSTINALHLDSPGHVRWWASPDVTLFHVMLHVITETTRHTGHADILREGLLEATHSTADDADWRAHRQRIDRAARATQPE